MTRPCIRNGIVEVLDMSVLARPPCPASLKPHRLQQNRLQQLEPHLLSASLSRDAGGGGRSRRARTPAEAHAPRRPFVAAARGQEAGSLSLSLHRRKSTGGQSDTFESQSHQRKRSFDQKTPRRRGGEEGGGPTSALPGRQRPKRYGPSASVHKGRRAIESSSATGLRSRSPSRAASSPMPHKGHKYPSLCIHASPSFKKGNHMLATLFPGVSNTYCGCQAPTTPPIPTNYQKPRNHQCTCLVAKRCA